MNETQWVAQAILTNKVSGWVAWLINT